ncbi:hypothetical protein SteCoe_5164 [Stentor coeruleus]|uniref:Prokaryotic-type class I peptide chain release factors domain-containing protein n=1 Tax=Stentor coeruleus TaxID=5963 RepID=A0A1R2CT40_9CILI|nr:hypothetical protein SteCoe_5164 [Stentor coeruleus]
MLKLLKRSIKFTINPNDVIEKICSGSGPGGQKVNKSENCVNLLHVPTRVKVKVHDSRDLIINRHIAWKRLTEKVEFQINGDDSKIARRIEKKRKNKERKRRKYAERDNIVTKGDEKKEENKPEISSDDSDDSDDNGVENVKTT